MKKIILISVIYIQMLYANPFQEWTTLRYQTSIDCFYSGIKRIYLPYPGIGTLACLKTAVELIPEPNKSFHLMLGHTAGLMGASLVTFLGLIIAAKLGIPHAKTILGPELTRWLVKK